jgi:hypothetical protein
MAGGQVSITVADGGSATIIVPGSSTQLVIGCSSSGTANQIVATRTPATLQANFGSGPLVEAAALACLQGGTVLAMKVPSASAGVASAVTASQGTGVSAGTSIVTVTGAPYDAYYVKVLVVTGGTVGTAGCAVQVSLDAGRNFGPTLALGSATTLALTGTGMTLAFAAGTLIAGNFFTFGCTEPVWNTAGIQAALSVFQGSTYGSTGVGSIHIVDGPMGGANCTTIEGYLDAMATAYVWTRAFGSAVDASPASIWGGTAVTESAWMTAIGTDYSACAARRMCIGAGYYNMPSAFPLPSLAGAPSYRRPITWSAAARQVTVPAQRHLGRVRDGSLSTITVNPTTDPQDGFIYHNEYLNPGLDYLIAGTGSNRFMSVMTRPGLPGIYITNPLTQAPLGSDYYLLPRGNVMDIFCQVVHTTGQTFIDDDIRLNANGTIYENDAAKIEGLITNACNVALFGANKMVSQKLVAKQNIVVDRTVNVAATGNVVITGQIVGKGYVLSESVTLSFQNPLAAT